MEPPRTGDPFTARFEVPVAGGLLHVARAGPPPDAAEYVVLAAHGVTASLMTWRTVARELDGGAYLLAPDLRGRGRSAALPGPYGMAVHVDDLLAVLDHVGASSVLLAGPSMGAYVMALLAAPSTWPGSWRPVSPTGCWRAGSVQPAP